MGTKLTYEQLKQLLHYDPETGHFTWLKSVSSRLRAGGRAGRERTNRYRYVTVQRVRYAEHRLAILLTIGSWPEHEVDHINGNPWDNRISNLRVCTHAENHQNRKMPSHNRTGFQGVTWHKQRSKWRAYVGVSGKHKHIGLFDTKEEAHEAYLKAKAQLHTFQPTPRTQ